MESLKYTFDYPHYTLNIPEYSDWQVTLTAGATLRPLKGKEPNWFWRKMQYLAFGFKWEKVAPTES
jgi:hypothetical protein